MALLSPAHSTPMRSMAARFMAILVLLGLASSAPAQQAVKRDELKAAFVFQFANYVQWPESSFKDAESPIVIGIVGNDAMVKTLTTSVRGKTVGARGINVVDVSTKEAAESCHILFTQYSDERDEKRVDEYLSYTRTKPILTVSDDDNFTEEGGIIRLFEKDNKLRFEINVDEAERSGLTISSKLLGLAQIVRDKT